MVLRTARKAVMVVGTSTAALMASGAAFAQEAQMSPGAEQADGRDIIVTALKRGTRIQETPISISAVTGEYLANSGAQNLGDLASSTPSLTIVDSGPQGRRIVIRGIQAAGEPTVGVYYDEVPVTGVVAGTADSGRNTPEIHMFDVERVEVLRGPQGTLYGAGSMGGTLRLIYKKPVFETQGAVDGTVSATKSGGVNYEINGVLNVPIINDKIALRASGFYRRNEGYIDNVQLRIKNVNDEKSYGGRATLRIVPTEDLTIDLAAIFNKSEGNTPSWIKEVGRYQTDNLVQLPQNTRLNIYSGTAVYDLGGVTATAVVSWTDRSINYTTDPSRFIASFGNAASYNRFCVTGAAAGRCTNPTYVLPGSPGVPAGGITNLQQYLAYVDQQSVGAVLADTDSETLSSEFRLSSSGNTAINWTAGVFYSWRKANGLVGFVNADRATGVIITPLQLNTNRVNQDILKNYAAFADVSWDITPEFNIAGGVRFFKYKRNVVSTSTVPNILSGAIVEAPLALASDESGQVFRANASYKITPDIMLYAQAAQGFRPGGVNNVTGLPSEFAPFESDKLWNYEAGIKTSFFDRKVTLNFNGFLIDWTNMQIIARTANGAYSFVGNAGAAKVKGLELETTIRPVDGLSIQASGSYIDAKLTENQANATLSAPGLKGDRIPYVPKFTAAISTQYVVPVSDTLEVLTRIDYSHTSGSLSDFRPFVAGGASRFTRTIDAYDLVNLRIGVQTSKEGWGAYVFVTNLLNATAITRASSGLTEFGQTYVSSARPRTFGLNLRGSF